MSGALDFVAQPQETFLDPDALQKLKDLRKLPGSEKTKLDQKMADALKFLRTCAGEVNDCGYNERIRHRKKLKHLDKENQDEPEDEAAEFKSLQERVEMTTKKLDVATRTIIDDQIWLRDVPVTIDQVAKRLDADAKRSTQSQTQTQQIRDSMNDDHENEEGEDSINPPPQSENPTALIGAIFSESKEAWDAMSLTERYSANHEYVDFYRTVFDANHQTDGRPPMPHADEWFAVEEGRVSKKIPGGSQRKRGLSQDDEDEEVLPDAADMQSDDSMSEIEVQAERIRLKCPITLRYFEEPLKSTKCVHAFEKKHILEWLHKSTERAPVTAEQQEELSQIHEPRERARREVQIRTPIVRCPECNIALTKEDLRPDPVLARMVERELARLKKEEEQQRRGTGTFDAEDDSDDDDIPRATQRRNVVNIGSSPARSGHARISGKHVKAERLSVVPQTQLEQPAEESDDSD